MLRDYQHTYGKAIDMVGMRFGRLAVVRRYPKNSKAAYWLCVCDCGKEAVVRGTNLRRGKTKSCGCLHDELSSLRITEQNHRHGGSDTRLYGIWTDMKKRCVNPNHGAFQRYGGRGITFDPLWKEYEPFEMWAREHGYSETLTLDRKYNDGPYSPENCRWVSRKTQGRNKSNNIIYEYNGEKLTLADWAERYGINYSSLYGRINNYGWTIEKALTTPIRRRVDVCVDASQLPSRSI